MKPLVLEKDTDGKDEYTGGIQNIRAEEKGKVSNLK